MLQDEMTFQDDVFFCRCGHIHFRSGEDRKISYLTNKPLAIICANCGTVYKCTCNTTLIAAYDLRDLPIKETRAALINQHYAADITSNFLGFCKVYYSYGYAVPMTNGLDADTFKNNRFKVKSYRGKQQVDKKKFLRNIPKQVLDVLRTYHFPNLGRDYAESEYQP